MTHSNKIGILISFFAIWINMFFSYKYQQFIGFVVIFLFGILHGANDLALYQKINEGQNSISLKKILTYYIVIVFLGAILFYIFPMIALVLFILFSGYHFGEQHWNKLDEENKDKTQTIFQTIYGLFILFLLFQFHESEVKLIIFQISKTSIELLDFKMITLITGILLIISGIILNIKTTKLKSEVILNIFYLLVFAIVFKTADLIWAFAIYFVVWHSFPSIKEQIYFLYGSYSFKNFKRYFQSAFVYWIISLFGIGILYFLFKDKEIFNALFFSFLAAITFPHTIVIIKMQNKV